MIIVEEKYVIQSLDATADTCHARALVNDFPTYLLYYYQK